MAPARKTVKASGLQMDKSHQAVSSYFIGPQAENLGDFRVNIDSILNQLEIARHNYHPEDGVSVSRSSSLIHVVLQLYDYHPPNLDHQLTTMALF
jgi:hypothetical protein